jgi:hypothetical protein
MNKNRKFTSLIFLTILSISLFTTTTNTENTTAQTPQTPQTPTYIISVNNTNYYVTDTTNTITTSHPTANEAFNHAANIATAGQKIYIDKGTYTATNTPIQMQNMTNIEIIFHPNAILTIPNNFNKAVFRLWYSQNVTINGITIEGNRFEQTGSIFEPIYNINGIVIGDSSFCTVINANITNVRGYGFQTGNNYPTLGNNGIQNSTITHCDWNGMCINWGGPYSHDDFAINNTVTDFSDVGITTLGSGAIIANNHIANGTGIRGSEPPPNEYAHYGIAVEAQYNDNISGNIILNNTIENMAGDWCGAGIAIGTTSYGTVSNNYIASNLIRNCTTGITAYYTSGDVIVNNIVENWRTEAGAAGIWITYQTQNQIITNNTLRTNTQNPDQGANGIQIELNSNHNTITNNTITIPTNTQKDAIHLSSATHSFIANNTLTSYRGIYVAKGSDHNRFKTNNYINCIINATDNKDNQNNLWIEPPSTLTPTTLFYDGFESGNANQWTGTYGTDITYSTTIKHNGTYAAHIPTNDKFIWKLDDPIDELTASAYIYIDNLPPEGQTSNLMFIGTGTTHYASNTLAEATLKTTNGISTLGLTYAYAYGDGRTQLIETNQQISDKTWFKITLSYKQNDIAEIWYNDQLITQSGPTNQWLQPNGLWLQAYLTGAVYYDDCTISTTSQKNNNINTKTSTSILAINNPTIHATTTPQGLYILPNTDTQQITTTTNDPTQIILNIDGKNYTLTNNQQTTTIDMTSDHIIYTIQTLQTNPTPTPPQTPPNKNIQLTNQI